MRTRLIPFCFALLVAAAGIAYAKGPVSGEIQAFLVTVNEDGTEKIVPADQTEPGQVMEFQIVFTNSGESDVSGIKVVDPIPEFTKFIGDSHGSDVPAMFEVSIDGGVTFEAEPIVRTEVQADGSEKEVVIAPDQYTHLRWSSKEALVSNGGKHSFSYRVSVQ
jgi:uncharacterized repeat protein (TIGR01451 family)